MARKKSSNIKNKAAIAAIAAGAAVAGNIDDARYEDAAGQMPAVAYTPKELAEDPEKLREAYEAMAAARNVYEVVTSTRKKIKATAGFLVRAFPGFATTGLGEPEELAFSDLEEADIPMESFTPLVDLGAFDLQKLQDGTLDLSRLRDQKVKEIVIMEDRSPTFFLNYAGYNEGQEVPLNRHGDQTVKWTMADLKKLVDNLHGNGINVVIGFWGNTSGWQDNPFVRNNWEALKPVIPISDDINPLSMVTDEYGNEMPLAEYTVHQYAKLDHDFDFDGLFLADGFMGSRAFFDPHGPYDFSGFQNIWTDFYRRIYNGVKHVDSDDTLWAYDCLGRGSTKSLANGVNLQDIAPYIDHLNFQAYGNDAWGNGYMNLPGYDLARDKREITDLPPEIRKKTKYTIGLGDSVEGWIGKKAGINAKHEALQEHAPGGTLGVWSNEIVRRLLK